MEGESRDQQDAANLTINGFRSLVVVADMNFQGSSNKILRQLCIFSNTKASAILVFELHVLHFRYAHAGKYCQMIRLCADSCSPTDMSPAQEWRTQGTSRVWIS